MRNLNNAKTGRKKNHTRENHRSGPGYMGKNLVGHRRRCGYGYKDAEVKVCVEKESKICSAEVRLEVACGLCAWKRGCWRMGLREPSATSACGDFVARARASMVFRAVRAVLACGRR